MSMAGWIKLHRKFLEWEWYHDIPCKVLAIHYLLSANFEDKKWNGIMVKRGQFCFSLASLSSSLGLSVKNIRTANKKLSDCGFCGIQSTNKYSIVTICKYENYQGLSSGSRQTNGNHVANEGQSIGKPLATTKESKKEDFINSYPSVPRHEGLVSVSVSDKPVLECYNELVFNKPWTETVIINTRFAGYVDFSTDSFYEYLKKFFAKLQNEGEIMKSPKDAKSHFARWLEIELKKDKNGKRGTARKKVTESGADQKPDSETQKDYSARF